MEKEITSEYIESITNPKDLFGIDFKLQILKQREMRARCVDINEKYQKLHEKVVSKCGELTKHQLRFTDNNITNTGSWWHCNLCGKSFHFYDGEEPKGE